MEKVKVSKNSVATILNISFIAVLITYIAYIHLFLNPEKTDYKKTLLENPIRPDILISVKSLELKNTIGEFKLRKVDKDWQIYSPRLMPANTSIIKKILHELKELSISTIHQNDSLSRENYSLNNPNTIIKLTTDLGEKITIKIGLSNPIDNTLFISISDKPVIYQVNKFTESFNKYNFTSFIDSRVFSVDISKVKRFNIYQGTQAKAFNSISFGKDKLWKSHKYNTISQTNTIRTLKKILNIPPFMILDNGSEETRSGIKNYLDHPYYKISIKDLSNNTVHYTLSKPIKKLPNIKLEKRKYFIVKASNRKHPYIVDRKHLSLLPIRYKHLK